MKKLIVFLILLFALPAYAQVELARMSPAMVGGGVPVVAGPDTSSITFWWTCEGLTISTGDHSHGATTITGDAVSAVGKWTNGVSYAAWSNHYFASSSILTATEGRVGFWLKVNTWANDAWLFAFSIADGFVDHYCRISIVGGDELSAGWINSPDSTVYADSVNANLSTGTWYFIELAWKPASSVLDIYVNGVKKTSGSPTFSTFSNTRVYTGNPNTAIAYSVYMDNLIISSDSTLDLYTNFGTYDDFPG